jgi:hypothetical protein
MLAHAIPEMRWLISMINSTPYKIPPLRSARNVVAAETVCAQAEVRLHWISA